MSGHSLWPTETLNLHRNIASNVILYFDKLLANADEPTQLTSRHERSAGAVQRLYKFNVVVIMQIKARLKALLD